MRSNAEDDAAAVDRVREEEDETAKAAFWSAEDVSRRAMVMKDRIRFKRKRRSKLGENLYLMLDDKLIVSS